MELYYNEPAKKWMHCLPLGNGTLGMMVDGGVKEETLYLNDDTLWSGYPKSYLKAESSAKLEKIRSLIFEGKVGKAQALMKRSSLGEWSENYEPLGQIHLTYELDGAIKEYERKLDLVKGIHTTTFLAGNIKVKKEAFCSFPDGLGVLRIDAEQPIDFAVSADSLLQSEVVVQEDSIYLQGNAPDVSLPNYWKRNWRPIRYHQKKAMAFCGGVKIETDGTLTSQGAGLAVKGCTWAMLCIATATGFNGFAVMPNPNRSAAKKVVEQKLKSIQEYALLRKAHETDVSALMSRTEFQIANEEIYPPTNQLVERAKNGDFSVHLPMLYYQYARYMTVAGSREGSQALNLQGIWNEEVRPPWSSNYTTDINIEMNYWFTSSANLRECVAPYETLMEDILVTGTETAKVMYGCEGMCANVNIDLWRMTTPVKDDPVYAYFPLGGLWMSNELYQHTLFYDHADKVKEQFAVFEGACKFALDWLVEHNGELVTCPSSSPEVHYIKNGRAYSMSYATAFDLAVIWQTLTNFVEGCQRLHCESPLATRATEAIGRLRPFGLGEHGILEWEKDYPISEKGHRHFSPLYALYPGNRIGYYGKDQALLEGCCQLLQYRLKHGSGETGWSAAWSACLSARLHEGKQAYDCLKMLWSHSTHSNLFDKHPPCYFQIDGNFGGGAAIHEMLFQMHGNVLELLPALPNEWNEGKLTGVIVQGGAEISLHWKDAKITHLTSTLPICLLTKNLHSDFVAQANISLCAQV